MELRLRYVYWCILIFWQVDYCLLKPQKRFQLNCCHYNHCKTWLRWLPTVSWKVHGENENISILISFPWARGCLRTRISSYESNTSNILWRYILSTFWSIVNTIGSNSQYLRIGKKEKYLFRVCCCSCFVPVNMRFWKMRKSQNGLRGIFIINEHLIDNVSNFVIRNVVGAVFWE